MAKQQVKSPAFSFQGWDFGKWLQGHWKTIKETAKPLLPFYLAWQLGLPAPWTYIVGALGAGLLSALEYFVKEYK